MSFATMPKAKRYAGVVAVVTALVVAVVVAIVLHRRASLVPPPALVPAAWEVFRTSAGHVTHVEKLGLPCGKCHDFARDGFVNPGTASCQGCHVNPAAHGHGGSSPKNVTSARATATGETCLSCHAFAPNRAMPTCISCHATAQLAVAALPAVPAIITHASAACASCHVAHGEPPVVAKDCASCHDERATEHAKHTGTMGCADCHAPHAAAHDARASCVGCHAKTAATALRVGVRAGAGHTAHTLDGKTVGHDTCLDCHKPHDFVARAPQVCIGCHTAKPTLLAATVPAHANCASCHAPHAPNNAAAACVTCHADVHVAHDAHNACTSCHVPHNGDVTRKALACSTCHAKVAPSDTKGHAGGVACTGCHVHHDVAPAAKPALCATCHAGEVARASHTKGHAVCATCHGDDAHKPARAPACGSCHAAEKASAPRGHQVCTSCHDAHSGERAPTTTCASCHKMEAKSAHAAVSGGCATCHTPHGPGGVKVPPPCASCHAPSTFAALHTVQAHGVCASCHTAHAPPKSDRATCTTGCHVDRRTHQLQAASCAGCHTFRK